MSISIELFPILPANCLIETISETCAQEKFPNLDLAEIIEWSKEFLD